MKFLVLLILVGFTGIISTQQAFAEEDSLSFDSVHDFSEKGFDTGRFGYLTYGEKFYQYKSEPLGAPAAESYDRCHFTSSFVLDENSFSESGNVIYRFPDDMVWPGGYDNSTFYIVRSPSFNFPDDNNFEKLTPTKTDYGTVLEFEIVTGLNTFVANSTAFWDSQKSQIMDCSNPLDFKKQEYGYYDHVFPLKVQQNYAKMLGLPEDDFLCKPELSPVLKNDGSPACVKSETVSKLIERGWAKDEITMLAKTNSDNQKLIELLESGQVSEFNNLKETMDLSRTQVSLEGADLQGMDLRKINLERVHIEHANLKDANLQGIVLDYRNIQYTDLQGANLSNADISDAYLYDVNLQGADLTGAIMKNTHIYDSNLNNANLKDTDLRGVNFQAASVIGTNFQGADLQGALMAETNLKKLNFDDANMQFVNLKYADLHDASLQNVNLQNANLENANLRGANLSGADLQGVNLNNADLLETNLSNVQNLPISKEETRQRGAITE
ncbi:MAG: pentapeptide repeat-containing protein [Nitrosopumilus sp.]|nr:pentapeptide repeat-containing protein [Nitrosopumilus sp.]